MGQQRSADIIAQAILVLAIIVAATIVGTTDGADGEPRISGDALIGLYGAALGYIFGFVPAAVARRNGDGGRRSGGGE